MPTSPIAFVIFKIIDRIHPVIGTHDPVSIDLGHHRCGGNTSSNLVALFKAPLRKRQGDFLDSINEKKFRLRIQGQNRPSHGLKRGLQNVEFINIFAGDNPYSGGKRLSMDN